MPKWKGKWIWCSGEDAPKNFYLYVRKVINLPGTIGKATARVCADSRYKLIVNGKLVGRGPTRSFPEYQHYDEYDLSSILNTGNNIIAAIVHSFGENTFQYHLERASFLFDATIQIDGKTTNIVTDNTWKVLPSEAWYSDIPRMDVQLGFQEIYDMNKAPQGWTRLDYDDSQWQNAVPIGPVGTPPWKMIPREIPYLPEYQIYPAEVLETGAADASGIELAENDEMNISYIQCCEKRDITVTGLFQNAESLARCPSIDDFLESDLNKPSGEPAHLMQTRCDESNAGLEEVVVRPAGDGRSSYIVLDFGKEVMGYVNFKVKSKSGGIIDLGYSELIEESGIVNAHHNGVRYADRVILKPGEQEFETYDKRAFRYMQVDFRDLKDPVTIEFIGLRFSTYPVKWWGSFAASDPLLADIWNTSAYTVHLNMEDAYTDCPWRERAQWWGDARVEALANYYAFGDTALIRQGLNEMARSQHEDGITNCFAPGDLGPCTPIPSFTLIWILSLADYYLYTGDKSLVSKLYPNVRKALTWFTNQIDEMGLCSNLPYWMFIDWAPIDVRGAVTTLNCFLVGALTESAKLAKMLDRGSDAKMFIRIASELKKAINAHLLHQEKGVYIDCFCDGEPSKVVSEQSNSLAVLYNVAPEEKKEEILNYIHNPENEVVRAGSPYFSFYVLQALWETGVKDVAFNYIRDKWGNMLAQGATTCWEHWHNRDSLCHGWSGGPAMDLPAQILGIRPLTPGFRKFEIVPERFDLEWAEGTVPSVRGDITVYWKRGEEFTLGVSVPKGAKALVTLPDPVDPKLVKINGKKKQPENVESADAVDGRPVFAVKGKGSVEFTY